MTLRPSLAALAVTLLAGLAAAEAAPIVREPGAIYLSDFGEKPLKVALARPAPSYFDIGMTRYAGTLRFPQVVQAEAFAQDACRVRGNAQQGGVAAWIPYNELQGLPENFLANLQKAEDRRIQVEALIAQNEVAIGMTIEEVGRSLGKPQKKTKRADKDGTTQTWEFIKYDLVPQTAYAPGTTQTVIPGKPGKPGGVVTQSGYYAQTVYVKVPVGTLKVDFKDGIVEALDQSEGTLAGANATIVAPPITVFW